MQPAKTPEQLAQIFGCTIEQARQSIARTAATMRSSHAKALASKTGKYRGFSADWYADRAAAFDVACK